MMKFQGRKLRNEFKYYIHLHEYVTLRNMLTSHMQMDSYSLSGDGYGIRSLYFDGIQDHSLHDKNNGVFKRDKYRIRSYNGSDERIVLERKMKFGEFVSKEGVELTLEEYTKILAGDTEFLSHKEHPLCKEFYHAMAHRLFRPTVIVDYIREAYVYEQGNVRITFDKKLSAGINSYDLFDQHLVLEEAIIGPRTIMEVKFDSFLPDLVKRIIRPESFVRSTISKYVICRELSLKHHKE
jgi:hypothetical protein